jgi:NADP-dependent 3-hydroxy acid dehydrogenase YdfG
MPNFAPYANGHIILNGPEDARPTALRIVRDQGLDGQLQGKDFVVTGATSGLGFETARALHATGVDVYITGRDPLKGEEAVKTLSSDERPGKVVFVNLKLDSLKECLHRSKRDLTEDWRKAQCLNLQCW